ncbi:hypothetical protein OIU84_011819 [Salix udensis]|uniref:Uncharacterized protein n=1 Tax=Salix udensis TaxID=889485 RepID=A0AAD6NXL4_9ROSI|nr:hypothetical protein OIU84_011819 [Salix udensis]
MKKAQLVFIPSPVVGHLVSSVQFAKLVLDRNDSFLITILVLSNPSAGSISKYIESLASVHKQIKFISLPETIAPPSAESFFYVIVNQVIANDPAPIASVVFDLFCTAFIDVAKELGVPSHVFFTSGAAFLGSMLYLSDREENGQPKFRPTDPDYIIPFYANPVPYRVLPLMHKDEGYETFAHHGRRFKDANGIIVNTFSEVESHVVHALLARNDIPPIFNVGPLIDHKGKSLPGSDALVKDLGLAEELTLDFRRDCATDIVRAEDITKAVKTMMEQGGEFRNKAKAISEMAQKAVAEGGSSYVTLGNLINQWLENNP